MIVTLPFFLWSPGDFWNSVVTLQFRQPFRTDSLSLLAWWAARDFSTFARAVTTLARACATLRHLIEEST